MRIPPHQQKRGSGIGAMLFLASIASFFFFQVFMSIHSGIIWPTNTATDPRQLMESTNPGHFYGVVFNDFVFGLIFLGGSIYVAATLIKERKQNQKK